MEFKPGDVVHIEEEWLAEYEDPNTDYIVLEDYGNGRVKILTKSEGRALPDVSVVDSNMIFKIGHIDLK